MYFYRTLFLKQGIIQKNHIFLTIIIKKKVNQTKTKKYFKKK